MPSRPGEYAGWRFRVYILVHPLESSTCGYGGWLSTRWVGGEEPRGGAGGGGGGWQISY